jgi:hypothetical protein
MVMLFLLTSCITPFEPDIESGDVYKYVVSGLVNDNNDIQTVSISMASPVSDPRYIPVSGCNVIIKNDIGNEFLMTESTPGIYNGEIGRNYRVPGNSFKVEIVTPDGVQIESDFDRMEACPEVDSVYFLRRDIISNVSDNITKGIQFYLNLNGRNTNTTFFRWEVTETWEYHVPYPREWYYDGSIHHIFPPDYSRKICWSTETVKNVYTLSTLNLVENKYEKLPLNFIDNKTSRLVYGYSLLVEQFSLNEASYTYWDQLRINSGEQGGLYEKQPLTVVGNLRNITDPQQAVLGYFGASSIKSKRIFVRNVDNLDLEYQPICSPAILRKGLMEISREDYPAFLFATEDGYAPVLLSNECVDCLVFGGTNMKPEFWPY